MKVILSKDVQGLGLAGQVKEVSDGHARNFLIPKHLALPATSGILARVQKEEAEAEARVKKEQTQAQNLSKKNANLTFAVQGKAEKGKLFAAITKDQVATAVNSALHLAILPKQVIIRQAIKTYGLHDCEIKLSDTITTHAKIKVEKEA
ncbi:MAG TPA: 50S ribosomal protein L9 [Patescibacteria group bacterium]|nr:50S ribosomal protein L9 [Patescibacteria group bacterium]